MRNCARSERKATHDRYQPTAWTWTQCRASLGNNVRVVLPLGQRGECGNAVRERGRGGGRTLIEHPRKKGKRGRREASPGCPGGLARDGSPRRAGPGAGTAGLRDADARRQSVGMKT